jgi:prophage regulatory protein
LQGLQGLHDKEKSGNARKSIPEFIIMQLVHESRPQVRRDRFLRLPEVEAVTGLKKSTIYLLMKRGGGDFPRCVQITSRCVAWNEAAVFQWIQDKIAASRVALDLPLDASGAASPKSTDGACK